MKTMLSLPEQTVAQLDALAAARGTNRSALVVQLAAAATERERAARRRTVADLLGEPVARDGRGTDHVRADRNR